MEMFATLAKARITTVSTKGSSWWRSGIQPIDCLHCGYILGQYMSNKHNLP
jgi:hypothetical protein